MPSAVKQQVKVAILETNIKEKEERRDILQNQKHELKGIVRGIQACAEQMVNYQLHLRKELVALRSYRLVTKADDVYICELLDESPDHVKVRYKEKGEDAVEVEMKRDTVKEMSPLLAPEQRKDPIEYILRSKACDEAHKQFAGMVTANSNNALKLEGKIEEVLSEIEKLTNELEKEKNKEIVEEAPESLKTERTKSSKGASSKPSKTSNSKKGAIFSKKRKPRGSAKKD